MKRKDIRKIVSKISEGILDKLIDLVLFGVYYSAEMSPFSGGNLYQRFNRISRDFDRFDSQTLKNALKRAQEKGWLNSDLKFTDKGQKRLESILPKYEKKKKWDGKWYIVGYDVPEDKKYLREILRSHLKELGFGQLHKSFWICPFNFLGDVEKIVNQYNLSSFVLLAVSDKLGREPSSELAERIWKLRDINYEYGKYIIDVNSGEFTGQQAIFKYLMILNSDPQLSEDLLPDDWKGEEAYKIYRKISRGEKLSFKELEEN